MLGQLIGHFSEETFKGIPYIEKIKKISDELKRKNMEVEGDLYEDETKITCIISQNTDIVIVKENQHMYIRFLLRVFDTGENVLPQFKELEEKLMELTGTVKVIGKFYNDIYFVELHILDRKFAESILITEEYCKKTE